MSENAGKKTPGVEGILWESPEQKAAAVTRIGQWREYQPQPLKRIYIPKQNGKQRLRSIPVIEDRARQALYLQVLQPIAETQADRNSYGFRPKRRCADAIDQCFKALRQKTSATWILEGDIEGFFDHSAFSWIEEHIPMNKRLLAKWLRCGIIDRGTLYPTTAGVPQGGIISPVISNLVLDGLEQVVCGPSRSRRRHNIHYVRWADRLRHGVVKASLIAPVEMRELRELTRSRQTRVTAHPAVAKRRQKLREGANSKLGQGTSDVRGRNGRLRRRALAGRLTQAQRWVLAEFLVRLAEVEAALSRVETRMGEEVAHCSDPFVQAAVEWLESIPGVGERTAQTSIAAIGVAMGRFPAAQHLARWAGGCPGTNESAGKRKSGRRPRGASPGARPWWKPPGQRLGPRGHTGEL